MNRLVRIAILSLPLLAAACASSVLPVASGPLRPLNAQHWTPTPADIASLFALAGEAHP